MKSSRSFSGRARKWFKFTGARLPKTKKTDSKEQGPSCPALILNSSEKNLNKPDFPDRDAHLSIAYTLPVSPSTNGFTMESDAEEENLCTEMETDAIINESGAVTSESESLSESGGEEETEEFNVPVLKESLFLEDEQPAILDESLMENAKLNTRKRTFGQRRAKGIVTALDFKVEKVLKRPRISDFFEEPSTSTTVEESQGRELTTKTTEKLPETEDEAKVPEHEKHGLNLAVKKNESCEDASELSFIEEDTIQQPSSRTSLELAKLFFDKLDQEELAKTGDASPPPKSRPIVRSSRRALDFENDPEVVRLYKTHVSVCRGAGVKPLSVKQFWEQRKHRDKPSDRVYNGFFDEE